MAAQKKKILIFAGTRPEVIKLAPIVLELRKNHPYIETILCTTGQHREMLRQALSDFNLSADIELSVMKPGQSLASLSSLLFQKIDETIEKTAPNTIVVQGDTTTVQVAALCGYYRQIQVAHVEAGLRSFDRWAPFPEEINRRVVSLVGDLHFAPTDTVKMNLLSEKIDEKNIHVTGNTVIDALLMTVDETRKNPPVLPDDLEVKLSKFPKMILVTGHRRESFGRGFENICSAIRELADKHEDVLFVYPVHLNPNVRKPVHDLLENHDRVVLIDPQPYRAFVRLMDKSYLLLTDSGGIQEEGPSLNKPVLVMRETTERPEGIEAGVSRLIGNSKDGIVTGVERILCDKAEYQKMIGARNPYGNGQAAQQIATILAR